MERVSAEREAASHLRVCLLAGPGQDEVEAAVRLCCPAPHIVEPMVLDDAFAARLSDRLDTLRSADAVLLAWSPDVAARAEALMPALRQTRVPIVAICGDHPEDHVAALRAGADDVVVMPLYVPLVQARLYALKRFAGSVAASPVAAGGPDPMVGRLRIDPRRRQAYVGDEPVELTPKEYDLLAYLMSRAEECCTRDDILDNVWGIDFDTGTNMTDVYMYYLRAKLKRHGLGKMLQTVRGRGYRLVPAEPDPVVS